MEGREYNWGIYIPIWLDLLSLKEYKNSLRQLDLHSNMVRFIIAIRSHNFSF